MRAADLPPSLPGHWDTEEGRDIAAQYAEMTRDRLTKSDLSDFQLANAQYLCGRMDMDLVAYQTAAKERIRWLSVRLALSEAAGLAMAARLEALTGGLPNIDAWERAAALLGESFGIGREAAHQIIRTDAGAKRIYDCALQTIANLEARK